MSDNDSGWVNKQYDNLLDLAVKERDPQKRLDLLSQAEQILVTELPILPMRAGASRFLR